MEGLTPARVSAPVTLFFLRPSTGCIHFVQSGSLSEAQARIAGCILIPYDDLHHVTHLTRADRRAWAEKRAT